MKKVANFIIALAGIVFILVGLAWFFLPEMVGAQLGMKLLEGAGLSSQIGDLGSFFLTMGSCILIGFKTENKIWFYPVIMLLLIATTGRIFAWLLHDAAFTIDMIAFEVVVASLLYYSSTTIEK